MKGFTKSPLSVGLIALGIIILIGSAVAAGMLQSYLGYSSLKFLSAIPFAIILISTGVFVGKNGIECCAPKELPAKKMVSIGTSEAPLDLAGITADLKKQEGRIETLVIYGNGSVEILEDPGILRLEPKKAILVGAKLANGASDGTRPFWKILNDAKWVTVRMSLQEALKQRPSRPHTMYLVD